MPRATPILQKTYQQAWYTQRRTERLILATTRLGGKCVICGTTDALDFHHKDPTTKVFGIVEGISRKLEDFLTELDKCELRCHKHHKTITLAHNGWQEESTLTGRQHGKITTYKNGCRCSECRAANRMRVWRNRQTQRT